MAAAHAPGPDTLPAPRPPCGRLVGDLSDSTRRGVATLLGRAVVAYALAQIQVRQADDDLHEQARRLDNALAAKPWQTFENLCSDEPDKEVTQPVTVATDVKIGLTALLLGLCDLLRASGPPPAPADDPLAWLSGQPWLEASFLRLLLSASSRMSHLLRADPLSRDLDFPDGIRKRLEAVIRDVLPLAPKQKPPFVLLHYRLSMALLDFLRILGWFAGNRAYENEHLCLNRSAFFEFLAFLVAVCPKEAAPDVGATTRRLRHQLDSWDRALLKGKLLASKPAPKNAGALAPSPAKAPPSAAAAPASSPPAAPDGPGAPAPLARSGARPSAIELVYED